MALPRVRLFQYGCFFFFPTSFISFFILWPCFNFTSTVCTVALFWLQYLHYSTDAINTSSPTARLVPGASATADPLHILIAGPLASLVQGSSSPPASVPQWTSACRSQLFSAAIGGQWPQVRVARISADTSDYRCQLCDSALGTLGHRRCSPVTMPYDGWPPPPAGIINDKTPIVMTLAATTTAKL